MEMKQVKSINQSIYFYLLLVGVIGFLFILFSEFFYNIRIISNYSDALLFPFLIIDLVVLLFFVILYIRKFNDVKGKVLLSILIISGLIFSFFLIVNLLVMF